MTRQEAEVIAKTLKDVLREAFGRISTRLERIEANLSERASASRLVEMNLELRKKISDLENACDAHRRHLKALEEKFGKLKNGA